MKVYSDSTRNVLIQTSACSFFYFLFKNNKHKNFILFTDLIPFLNEVNFAQLVRFERHYRRTTLLFLYLYNMLFERKL